MTHIFTAVTDDWLPLWDLVRPNWEEYCARHGYTLYVEREFAGAMPFTFEKIWEVSRYFYGNPDIESLWVMDADIVFTNMAIPIEQYKDDPQKSRFLTITKDINGLNSGVFNLHRPWHNDLALAWCYSVVEMHKVCRSEQDAIQILEEAYILWTDYIKHPSFNSIVLDEYPIYAGKYTEKDGNWAPGHLLAHFPGMSMEQRLSLIPKYLALVQR